MANVLETLNQRLQHLVRYCSQNFSAGTAQLLEWCSVVLLSLVFVPTYLSMMAAETAELPALDVAVLVWITLLLLLLRAAVLRNTLNVVTIALGFALQLVLVALTFFV